MKKIYQSIRYKKYLIRKNRREMKARYKFNRRRKRKNILKLNKPRFVFRHQRDWVDVVAPKIFSLLKNPDETIIFINSLDQNLLKRKAVFVRLTNVIEIDYGAIAVLFSVMDLYRIKRVKFDGDKPTNEVAADILEKSGFLPELFRKETNKIKYRLGIENQIFTKSEKKVEASLGLPVMKEASETIWGQKKICKGLQRILLELMHNTNNHAGGIGGQGNEKWCLSVNHKKEEKKVEFVFVDYGVGIFNSLYHKPKGSKWYGWREKTGLSFSQEQNNDLLRRLLEGEIHRSVTGKKFRGKGLPGIKEVLDRNQVSNLFIISNNTYADVSKNKYLRLNQNLSGTFIYWELCYSNENKPWKI